MKKQFLNIGLGIALIAGLSLTSCSSEDSPAQKDQVDVLIEQGVLNGMLDHSVTLDATKTYSLAGPFIIKDGASLIIPAGTTIKATEGFGSYIMTLQGGKIYINGTADKPVTMTAAGANPSAGYWGGLILNGKAKISGPSGVVATSSCEMNADYPYGGNDDADNSGSITYLKILYAGARSSAEVEHNGLTLDAVGSGTRVENIYIYESADDGFECFGGTVNVKNVLVVNPDDDMFDNTQGYRGSWENLYGIWEKGYTSTESDPRGIESDGNLDGKNPDNVNQTDFTVRNMTIDLKLDYNSATQATFMQDVIKIRRGAKVNINNAFVQGSGAAQDFVDCTDSNGDAATGTVINITNNLTNPITGTAQKPGKNNASITIASGNTGCDKSLFAWTGYTNF
jgi:hypothetical protein